MRISLIGFPLSGRRLRPETPPCFGSRRVYLTRGPLAGDSPRHACPRQGNRASCLCAYDGQMGERRQGDHKALTGPARAVGWSARECMGEPAGGLPKQPEVIHVTNLPEQFDKDVVVIGGCGHVGLPLAIAFADRGAPVGIYDVSQAAVDTVNAGRMPFAEAGAEEVLRRVLGAGRLEASADPAIVATAQNVVVVIGTPVDEHLNPNQTAITKALGGCSEHLRDGQLLILRSTVFPGVTALVEKMVAGLGLQIEVAFCPERIAEGKAMTELFELPQIVSARTPAGAERASALFGRLTGKLVVLSPEEAELAKLYTNVL